MSETDPIASGRSAPADVDLPATAAWRHLNARAGFQVLFLRHENNRYYLDGQVTAVEEGEAWSVCYTLTLDSNWATRSAHILRAGNAHCHSLGRALAALRRDFRAAAHRGARHRRCGSSCRTTPSRACTQSFSAFVPAARRACV
jgi:Putative glycolipid-binding